MQNCYEIPSGFCPRILKRASKFYIAESFIKQNNKYDLGVKASVIYDLSYTERTIFFKKKSHSDVMDF